MATQTSLPTALAKPFDYIVVGGGTAGLVVASRLTEDSDVRVLVIEAGADRTADPLIQVPGLVAAVYGNKDYDWNFSSVPQPELHNRCINQARGKMLGGSSALNFMMLLYPSKGILDAWASLGNSGWDFESLSPYLNKFATVHTPPQSARDVLGLTYHNDGLASGDGPIQVSFSEGYGPMNVAWMNTFAEQGLEVKADHRSGKVLGAFQNAASIDPATKTRSFAATAYYNAEVRQRTNLVVLTETVGNKIILDTTGSEPVATGVGIVTKDGQKIEVSASVEIILAAGALQTPQILELSGIGGQDLLQKHGIPVVVNNANVGEGMQDHPIVCQSFEVKDGVPSGDVLRDPAVVQALMGMYATTGGGGPMGQSNISVAYAPIVDASGPVSASAKKDLFAAHEATCLTTPAQQAIRNLIESPTEPAIQYLLFPTQITITDNPVNMGEYIIPSRPENYFTVMTVLNHPFSRGSVHITSADVSALPAWDPMYNSNKLDMEVLSRAVQFVERLVAPTSPFGSLLKGGEKERLPPIVADDLEKAKEIVRQRQISVFHVSGSCSMLPREQGGVVDNRLRVYGVGKLRVVDASVFPLEPLGNIQATVYAVAERAADLIKEDRAARA
ncbi:hypothetical protein B0H63DRAFT_480461 [Podospora didyma]|uniref:Glucose-methanol-choline oxidoreductase N-terminal domain-containing protein n=1 Tax=Podospora didyma TaxID=330526 RepID=A0AAE0KE58_9PEZI|nr:hypothetical protein B0H63DRAFT_480461 [Podospora didyma]